MTLNQIRKSPVTRLLDGIGSVPFGVTMLVLILVYSWVGSAGLAPFKEVFIRQAFEKTEMEWFSWWPFNLLVAVFCLSLTLVTVRRIPLTLPKLGIWVTHAGVLVLCLGCAVYFGEKVEGQVAVYRRLALLHAPGADPVAMRLQPGAEAALHAPAGHYHVRVTELNPEYTLLTGADAGKRTFMAQLLVEPPAAAPFIRQVLVGYPEYTEDVVPGQGRAIKVLGRALVDETFRVELDYAPETRFAVRDRPALHLRAAGSEDWTEYPLRGLPRYRERVAAGEKVFSPRGAPRPHPRPLELRPAAKENGGGLPPGLSVRVSGYLPFATLEESWEPGGDDLYPHIVYTTEVGGSTFTEELLAFDPARNRLFNGVFDVVFRWVESEVELARLLDPGEPMLVVRIPSKGFTARLPLAAIRDREVAVAGTAYRVQLEQYFPRWSLAGSGRAGQPASMALVRFSGPEGRLRRAVVHPDASLSQDLDEGGMRHAALIDEAVVMELENLSDAGLTFAAGPHGLHALLISQDGTVMHQPVELGQPFEFLDGHLKLTVDELCERARRVMRPAIVPVEERDAKAGAAYSLVKVVLERDGWSDERWVEFSAYRYPTRMGYQPQRVELPGGEYLELVYSEETWPLPAPVALESFQLETYPGQMRERDYISLVRFGGEEGWTEPKQVRSNRPAEHRGWWFFQSTWDPPAPDMNYAGMNFTGLGVGNRRGVTIMVLGASMAMLGAAFSFYVKPVILRRRAQRWTRTGGGRAAASEPPASPGVERVEETVRT